MVATALLMSCESDAPVLSGAATATDGVDGTGSGESSGGAELDDAACLAAGGRFGIVAGPRRISGDLGPLDGSFFRSLGLVARDDGLFAKFVREDPGTEGEAWGYRAELDLDGRPLQPAIAEDAEWIDGRIWRGDDALFVLYCDEDALAWRFLDLHGNPTSPATAAPDAPRCFDRSPSAAWLPDGAVLVAWIGWFEQCEEGSCVLATRVVPGGASALHELHPAGHVGHSPSVRVVAGSSAAAIAMVRWDSQADLVDLVVTIVDFTGAAVAGPVAIPLPQSSQGDELHFLHAQPVADAGDGFFVYVAGYGPSSARVHIGAAGQILEPLVELPLIVDIPVASVYEFRPIDAMRREHGSMLYGQVAKHGLVNLLVTGLDPLGEPAGYVDTNGTSLALATLGSRTWMLADYAGGGLEISELGCAFD